MSTLYKKLLRIAQDNPGPLQRELIPLLVNASLNCKSLTGGERHEWLPVVWGMYETSYRSIGLHLTGPSEMMKYDVWDLCLDSDGIPRAFNLYKKTPYGLKSALSGSDGSAEGKSYAVNSLKKKFLVPGIYGEVSHKVESIVLSTGAPVVCNSYVPEVLGKPVNPDVDGLHYTRSLGEVGNVKKILVGLPRGVPVTNVHNPSCPAVKTGTSHIRLPVSVEDIGHHLSCLLF